jgi:hypothetical protein
VHQNRRKRVKLEKMGKIDVDDIDWLNRIADKVDEATGVALEPEAKKQKRESSEPKASRSPTFVKAGSQDRMSVDNSPHKSTYRAESVDGNGSDANSIRSMATIPGFKRFFHRTLRKGKTLEPEQALRTFDRLREKIDKKPIGYGQSKAITEWAEDVVKSNAQEHFDASKIFTEGECDRLHRTFIARKKNAIDYLRYLEAKFQTLEYDKQKTYTDDEMMPIKSGMDDIAQQHQRIQAYKSRLDRLEDRKAELKGYTLSKRPNTSYSQNAKGGAGNPNSIPLGPRGFRNSRETSTLGSGSDLQFQSKNSHSVASMFLDGNLRQLEERYIELLREGRAAGYEVGNSSGRFKSQALDKKRARFNEAEELKRDIIAKAKQMFEKPQDLLKEEQNLDQEYKDGDRARSNRIKELESQKRVLHSTQFDPNLDPVNDDIAKTRLRMALVEAKQEVFGLGRFRGHATRSFSPFRPRGSRDTSMTQNEPQQTSPRRRLSGSPKVKTTKAGEGELSPRKRFSPKRSPRLETVMQTTPKQGSEKAKKSPIVSSPSRRSSELQKRRPSPFLSASPRSPKHKSDEEEILYLDTPTGSDDEKVADPKTAEGRKKEYRKWRTELRATLKQTSTIHERNKQVSKWNTFAKQKFFRKRSNKKN